MPPKDYRMPSPGSQPTYAQPETAASNISGNYYYQRDSRRNFPRTLIVTQEDLAKRLTAPAPEQVATADVIPAAADVSLTTAIAQAKEPFFKPGQLPPVPGTAYKWRLSTDVSPPPPNTYWPIYSVY
jgi:hypothetical protein